MDFSAVTTATDDQLRELGVLRRGDLLSLQGFVKQKLKGENRDEKKRKLLDLLKGKGKPKKKKAEDKTGTGSGATCSSKGKETSQRKIHLGWLHFDPSQKRYVSVRLLKGGGTRTVSVEVNSNVQDLVKIGQSIFFPNGESFFGNIAEMRFSVGNFKCQEIVKNLTLSKYIDDNALSRDRVRLYLMTKSDKKQCESLESDDDLPPVFEVDRMVNQVDTRGGDAGVDVSQSKLIGTSADRETIRGRQEKEYEESLAVDQSKEQERLKKEETLRKQLYLQEARKARVPMEPSINEQCAVISVRHVVLGIQKRKFKTTEKMSAVYDWVGSLSSQPESFSLSGCGLPELLPSLSVMAADRSILNMTETETMHSYPEDELNFVGFGDILGTDHTDTFQDWLFSVGDINDTLPDIVMQGDLYR